MYKNPQKPPTPGMRSLERCVHVRGFVTETRNHAGPGTDRGDRGCTKIWNAGINAGILKPGTQNY